MSWKDYLYFTKTERNGIIILCILIVGIIFYPFIHRQLFKPEVYDYTNFSNQIQKYESLKAEFLLARESIEASLKPQSISELQLNLHPFDPNEFSQEQMADMGLPGRVIRNIVNYRNAGGSFRYKEDLSRIYSIDDELYSSLESFILLPDRPQYTTRETAKGQKTQESYERSSPPSWAEIVVDINRADTTQWQQIRGIGPVFSRRITSYRELLGGFYSLEQLLEVYGMDTIRFEQIKPSLKLSDTLNLRQININTADFATLIRHPYLDRNQVNSILQIRNRHGPYSAATDILQSELIDDRSFEKIKAYIKVTDDSNK